MLEERCSGARSGAAGAVFFVASGGRAGRFCDVWQLGGALAPGGHRDWRCARAQSEQ